MTCYEHFPGIISVLWREELIREYLLQASCRRRPVRYTNPLLSFCCLIFANIPIILIFQADHLVFFSRALHVVRCTADALNGRDVRGKIVLCVAFPVSPLALFPLALKNVLDGEGSGIIFAQYSMNILDATADCKGIPCILVDFYTANQIGNYMSDAR